MFGQIPAYAGIAVSMESAVAVPLSALLIQIIYDNGLAAAFEPLR